jgi:ribose transport system substrate-binding protein
VFPRDIAHLLRRLLVTIAGLCFLPLAAQAEDIGVILHGQSHGFFRGLERGMRRAADELGVHLVVRSLSERAIYDSRDDVQLQVIDYMLGQKVAGIIMAPEALKDGHARVSAPVPLVLVDRDGPQFDARTTVSTDNFAAGREAARSLAPVLSHGANVVVLRLQPNVPSTTQREEGFISVAREKGWNVVSDPVVGNRFGKTAERIDEVLRDLNMRVDAIFAPNESIAFGAVNVVGAMPARARPHLAAVDWRPDFRQALENGVLYSTVLQNNDAMGRRAVEMAVAACRGERIPTRVSIGVVIATKANMNTPLVREMTANYEVQ